MYNPNSMTDEEVRRLWGIALKVRHSASTITFVQEVLDEAPGKNQLDRDTFTHAVEVLEAVEDEIEATLTDLSKLMEEVRKCRVYIDAPKDVNQTRYNAEPDASGDVRND